MRRDVRERSPVHEKADRDAEPRMDRQRDPAPRGPVELREDDAGDGRRVVEAARLLDYGNIFRATVVFPEAVPPAMPTTSVPNSSGAMIVLISVWPVLRSLPATGAPPV